MEILQNIWTALTTENELLTNILFIPFMFIEILITMLLFTSLLNINSSKKSQILYVIILSVLGNLTNTFIPKPYNTFINIFLCPLLVIFIFKVKIFKAIMAEILPNIIFVLVGAIILNLYILVFNISTNTIVTVPVYRLTSSVCIYTVVFLIYKLLKHFSINISLLDNIKKKTNMFLIINFVIGIVTVGIQSYIYSIYSDVLPFWIVLLSISTLLIYFIYSIFALIRTNKLETATLDLEQTKQYNKTLQILHDNIRCFKHDFNNIVTTIGGYVQAKDMEGLTKYYSHLQADCQKVNNLTSLSPEVINEPAIYSLLTNKYYLAEEKGISITLDVFMDLTTLKMKTYEFTRILGILMDNAIEASSECDKKLINVYIRKDSKRPRQLLIIENTYKDKNVDTEKIYEKGFSSKPNNTGLGLWEIRQILKKNSNLNLYTSKDNEFFKQQLEIYLN